MKYGDLRYVPREMARGVDLQFAGGGAEGLFSAAYVFGVENLCEFPDS